MELVARLTAVWGPSGREHKIAGEIAGLLAQNVDEVRTDRFGNVIGFKRGTGDGRRVLLAAHLDSPGALAMSISENGLIHLSAIGGLKAHHAVGQRVIWESGAVGVVQHESVDEPKELDSSKLFCDIGAVSKSAAEESVKVGDICALTGDVISFGDALVGPNLDNRAGCAVLLEVAQHLTATSHDVYFAFTRQGLVSARGAGPAAFGVEPEIAFVVDLAARGDAPRAGRSVGRVGKGPILKLKEANFMSHQGLCDTVRSVAEANAIPLQVIIGSGEAAQSESLSVSTTHSGVAVAPLEIPGRYRGTGAEMVNLRDMYGTADLILKLLADPLEI